MEGSNEAAPNDIENPCVRLETSMTIELDRLSSLSSSCCIYRVPQRLRCVNEKAYTPQVVSIGPLHHGKKGLQAMEEHKKRYLQDFLHRTQVSLGYFIKKISDQEVRLRNCYAETIELSSDEFVRIILVDAAFIIEFFLKYYSNEIKNENDRIFNKPWMANDLYTDMLLLENQLPFFILEGLLDPNHITVSSDSSSSITESPIINFSLKFLKFTIGIRTEEMEEYNLRRVRSSQVKVEHLIDFVRILSQPPFVRIQYQPPEDGQRMQRKAITAPSITKLHQAGVKVHQAGVKFKVGISTKNTFDIRFTDGILEIPELLIGDETELLFRNLIALEECIGTGSHHISDYVTMMNSLAESPKDVELLVHYGIVKNGIGDSSAVSTLFNNLTIGVFGGDDFYYASLCEELNKYCDSTWHKWKANLRQNYFKTPWATISVIAAVVLLILTLIQTICSIISAAK